MNTKIQFDQASAINQVVHAATTSSSVASSNLIANLFLDFKLTKKDNLHNYFFDLLGTHVGGVCQVPSSKHLDLNILASTAALLVDASNS